MPETKQLLRDTRDRIAPPPDVLGGLERLRRHKENMKRVAAAAVAIVIALLGFGGWFLLERDAAPKPADRSGELGIFAPVAGRILFEDDRGAWAVDPNGPSDTTPGPTVADDVASTLVPLPLDPKGFDGVTAIAWSRDGTELLIKRGNDEDLFPKEYLYILHADGSETQLNSEPMYLAGDSATFSPDGKRVVFAAQGDYLGLWVVDTDGDQPVPLPAPSYGLPDSPTFSPDGSQIAYLVYGDIPAGSPHENHVYIADGDGSHAHEILADDETRLSCGGLQWSPAGDRLACTESGTERNGDVDAIYTFAPDGSDFTRVINGGTAPYWSPDGTQIAFTKTGGGASLGLAIADADGSNVREFGFAASGPWNPGAVTTDEPAPTPVETPNPEEGLLRANGEVLDFTGRSFDVPGYLVAVNPETGEERVLVEDLEHVYSANWSADGRWVAYASMQPGSANGYVELWVVGSSLAPHQIATYGNGDLFADGSMGWVWSRTGAKLLTADLSSTDGDPQTIERSALAVTDFTTGETTDLGSIEGYAGYSPAWSPDGTRIALKRGDGSIYSVDLGSRERSLLAHFPEMDHDPASSIDSIQWSPDGTHLSVVKNLGDGGERLYVMDADGSNVRLLSEGYELLLDAWSPDGTRLAFAEGFQAEGEVRILVAPMDGSDPAEIGIVPFVGCTYHYECGVTWSADGSTIGFAKDKGDDYMLSADGSGGAEPLDDLTYRSWAGGCTDCGYRSGG